MPSLHADLTTRLALISDTPALDASVLLAHILNKPRTWVMAHPELRLTPEQQEQLDESLVRFENGEPFPYILGHWEFFGLDFDVTPDVLIPRPETELLVEKAIAWLQESPVRRTVADVGTGSATIAVSIAVHVPDTHILATDISESALEVARKNAKKFNVADRIDFIECDILPPHPDPFPTESHFDLICANLPYIPTDTLQGLPIYRREPTLALLRRTRDHGVEDEYGSFESEDTRRGYLATLRAAGFSGVRAAPAAGSLRERTYLLKPPLRWLNGSRIRKLWRAHTIIWVEPCWSPMISAAGR